MLRMIFVSFAKVKSAQNKERLPNLLRAPFIKLALLNGPGNRIQSW